jgi:hypothetical protein
MIPGFMIWKSLHWYNTLNPLWVPTFFMPSGPAGWKQLDRFKDEVVPAFSDRR